MITYNKYSDSIRFQVSSLPDEPGVYQFLDENEKIIYVGKAKRLKRRVTSYFDKVHNSAKINIMVRRIANIRHIVVNSEEDALLLENNLIKKYQPRYNVLLKDDKTYPWICIKKEPFPRVFFTRNLIKDGSEYFGPYSNIRMARAIMDMIRTIYKLRNCNFNLTEKNISEKKFKVCLEYHIGNCKAPCVGYENEDEYGQTIFDIKHILKGNIRVVTQYLKDKMVNFANEFKFEDAQKIKEKLNLLERYQSKSTIVSPTINNIDVYSIVDDDKYAYVNFLKIVNGSVIQVHTIEIKKKLNETREDLLPMAIADIRQKIPSTAKEIITPFKLNFSMQNVEFIIPLRGDKKRLLELSTRNAMYFKQEKIKKMEKLKPGRHTERILSGLKKDLHLTEFPIHIECFDNSNIQGSHPVASCVVFRNAKPSKKDYRHFNIKTVEGANDFASMEEIVYRRYKHLIDKARLLPQLIVVDGGKGQLKAALNSLERLGLRGKIAVIGIAKKLEEIYFPNDPYPLFLDKNSESLKIIQHLRNEAHRFGITFHRQKRSKALIKSELDQIDGIGGKTVEKLLSELKSIENIKNSTLEELTSIVGKAKATIIYKFFK